MVFFNDPVPLENHELQAVTLALAAQERVGELAQSWQKRGIQLGLGVGIDAGYATLGRIGFEGRYDYGAIGPVTNLASRLIDAITTVIEELEAKYGTTANDLRAAGASEADVASIVSKFLRPNRA
jgi:class 3 adenylate cyclase